MVYRFFTIFLWPLALLYEFAVFCRKLWYALGFVRPYKADIPVISIGNITAGGTGKTPMAIHVAQILMNKGLRVALLSRGYKRKTTGNGKQGAVVSDGVALKCSVDEAGDEPYLMAIRLLGSESKPGAMVIVGKDRVANAKRAVELGAKIIVLDDGFQHWRIKRDLDIVLLDSQKPFGNGWLLPAGRLREPKSALRRASTIVLTRCAPNGIQKTESGILNWGKPVFFARHEVMGLSRWPSDETCTPADLKGKRILLFSGIARPESFGRSIKGLGLDPTGHIAFGDHHNFGGADLDRIAAAAQSYDAVITTEKDAARLPAGWDPGKPLYVLRVGIEFARDAGRFESMILSAARTPPQPLPAAERGSA